MTTGSMKILITINRAVVLDRMAQLGIESQAELADVAQLDVSHLSKILHGKPFSSATLAALAGALNCAASSLIAQSDR
jgi:transcriptional regulator with XRE-family HTH domain